MPAPRVFLGLAQAGASVLPPPSPGDGWMSVPERQRLEAIAAPLRRQQFMSGRWLCRQVLAAAYGGDAQADWLLSAGHDGPPRLLCAPTRTGLHLNISISHSAGQVCCAVSDAAVGIDIEDMACRRDWQAMAGLVFTPEEQRRLAASADEAQAAGFCTAWTLKEAWLKSRGVGMSPDAMARLQTRALGDGETLHQANARSWRGDGFVMSLVMDAPAEIVWAVCMPGLGQAAAAWLVA